MKLWEEFRDLEGESHNVPERNLWLAVIERAIADYIMGTELEFCWRRDLERFFFLDTPTPCNLNYICNMLFDHGDDAANKIRRRIIKAAKHELTPAERQNYIRTRLSLRNILVKRRKFN